MSRTCIHCHKAEPEERLMPAMDYDMYEHENGTPITEEEYEWIHVECLSLKLDEFLDPDIFEEELMKGVEV